MVEKKTNLWPRLPSTTKIRIEKKKPQRLNSMNAKFKVERHWYYTDVGMLAAKLCHIQLILQ